LIVIQCGGVDVLRDDASAYGDKLKSAGVDVQVFCYKGVPHCFPVLLPAVVEANMFYETYNAFLNQHAA
jgi:acetyl esterase/lipase